MINYINYILHVQTLLGHPIRPWWPRPSPCSKSIWSLRGDPSKSPPDRGTATGEKSRQEQSIRLTDFTLRVGLRRFSFFLGLLVWVLFL